MKKLLLVLLATALVARAEAGPYDNVLTQARALDGYISAMSLVSSPDQLDVNRARGDLNTMLPFFENLSQSLAGVNVGPAQEIRSISIDLKVKIKNAQGETNLLKLAIDIVQNIRPGLERCGVLLPSLIDELEKLNVDPVQKAKDIVKALPTSTPAPAVSGGIERPTVVPTPVPARPTPSGPVVHVPGQHPPAVVVPPPPSNTGVIPPAHIPRPTATPIPQGSNSVPTTVPTPVGLLKAPVALASANNHREVFVTQVNVNKVAVVDTRLRRVVKTLDVGRRPVALAMAKNGSTLVVVNHDGNSVTLIDTRSRRVLGEVNVGAGPVDAEVSQDGKKAYVVNQGSGSVSVVLINARTVIKEIKVGAGPSRVHLLQNGRDLYVSNTQSDTVSIIDTAVDEVVAEVDQ